MMFQKLTSGLLRQVFFLFLLLAPAGGYADEVPSSGDGVINGVYELKDVTAAGVYAAGDEEAAREFVGYFLTIHGDHIVLPDSVLCHVASRERRTLRNGLESFGTAGGSWSQVGLEGSSEAGYEVTEILLDCDGPFLSLILQPESETYLLSYWSVFLILGRE